MRTPHLLLVAGAITVGSFVAVVPGTAWADEPQTERSWEPWTDADPKLTSKRLTLGDFGLTGGAEYRAQLTYINPISLNTIEERRATWIDHRLRVDAAIDYDKKIKIVSSVDILDGVLWGDNGTLGAEPETNAGTSVNARNPNSATPCIAYKGGADGDPLSANSYGYGLCPGEVFKVRRLYGEAVTPIGVFRVGRQPFTLGNNLQGTPGDGRFNRFGVAHEGAFVDRILFATKPLEAFKPAAQRNTAENEGLIAAVVYDHLVSDDLKLFGDDTHQAGGSVIFKAPKWPGGKDLDLSVFYVYRWNDLYSSHVNIFGAKALSKFGPVSVGLEGAGVVGETDEVSTAYRAITNDPITTQDIVQAGARAVVRVDQPYWGAYLEFDFASGDGDPRANTPLSAFVYSPDENVGLLLFENVLYFQTARSAAAATETLKRLNAPSFPVDSIDTRGSFTNAIAVFPQFDIKPIPELLFRVGVLVAYAPEAVVDPVQSLLRRDGTEIEDDLVNFAGGKPGHFYGAELDLRAGWRFLDHAALDLEGALLFPGDALEDENGDAVKSGMIQGRTTFFF